MWQLVIHSPNKESKLIEIKHGSITLGRADTNDIVVEDIAASRQHARIVFDSDADTISVIDLNSTNGTFVNNLRIMGTYRLNPDDQVSIGQFSLQLQRQKDINLGHQASSNTHPLTRELLMETMYKNSVVVYDAAISLNSVLTLETAIETTNMLLKQALGADRCEIIVANRLNNMGTGDFIDPLARRAARNRTAEITQTAMFIPLEFKDEMIGLVCVVRTSPDARSFEQNDLKLAIAISHQASLAMQRTRVLERARREEQVQRLMLRFISPAESENLVRDYYEFGELPGLKDQKVTVLFAEIANSTGLADDLGTEHFSKILNGFYRVATQVITTHKGMVKYLGDGVLAMFAEQQNELPDEEKAIITGRELINMLNRTGSLDPKQRIIVDVTVNTGNAMVGYVGTSESAEFNVLGDTVNLAQRMREYASPYKIIVGPATMAALDGKYHFRSVGAINLREKEQTVQVYELLP